MKGFAQGSKKIFGLFLFYHLSWFLAGPFYGIIEKKKWGRTFSAKAKDSKKIKVLREYR